MPNRLCGHEFARPRRADVRRTRLARPSVDAPIATPSLRTMTRTRLALAVALVPLLAACARRTTPEQESAATERPVADPAAAYACAAAAAQGMGYAVPAEVLDRARGEGRVAGGSFSAERRTPRDGQDSEVAELFVRVRARGDGGTIRVVPWRYEELYASTPAATSAPTVPPRMAPVATIAGDRRRQQGGRRGRTRRTLPAGPVAEDAATVAMQCAG